MKNIFYTFLFFVTLINNTNAQNNFHDTQGNLDISSSGSVNYTLPIAMPPTIGDFAPAINLVYSSGQFGGIAGQGWNITGISAIMRTATRRDIDGIIDGVDFDTNDKLSLDGQRLLLKSGNYFAAGAEYMTETQSNTKIEQVNTGTTTYFVVTAPDGTRSWYGNYGGMNAIEHTAYYIVRQEDTDGNFITYHYGIPAVYGKSLCISEIRFSANTVSNNTPLNKITFTYKKAIRSEFAYIGGVKKEKTELLSQVVVSTNNLQFKKYVLTHAIDSQLGYENVIKIQEFNSNNEAANPVEFEYGNTNIGNGIINSTPRNFQSGINLSYGVSNFGDFDGDGQIDFFRNGILYIKALDGNTNPIEYIVPNGGGMPISTLRNNKLIQKHSILSPIINENTIDLNVYDLNNNTVELLYTKTIAIDRTMTLSFKNSTGDPDDPCFQYWSNNMVASDNKRFINYSVGDFNGDGISELILLRGPSHLELEILPGSIMSWNQTGPGKQDGNWEYDPGGCNKTYNYSGQTDYFLIDLNPLQSVNFGSDGYLPINIDANCKIFPPVGSSGDGIQGLVGTFMDFNSDGKDDVLGFYDNNICKFCEFSKNGNSYQLNLSGQTSSSFFNSNNEKISGDYNGDGRPDFLIPHGVGSSTWRIFYANPSNVNLFDIQDVEITPYLKTLTINEPCASFWGWDGGRRQHNSYFGIDTNKDGKTDLVRMISEELFEDCFDRDSLWQVISFSNNVGNSIASNSFTLEYSSSGTGPVTPLSNTYDNSNTFYNHDHNDDGIPIGMAASYNNGANVSQLLILKNYSNSYSFINFAKDVAKDNRLTKVKHANGVIQDEIIYQEVLPSNVNNGLGSNSDFYSSTNALNYPFVEMSKMPNSYMVSQIKNTAMGLVRYQDFKYQGLVINMHGLGALGFTKTARSSWYRNSSDKKMWNVEVNNPLQRMSNAYSYIQLLPGSQAFSFANSVPTSGANGMLSVSQNFYTDATDSSTKLYTILLQNQSSKDFLKGTISSKSLEYYPTTNLFKKTISTNALLASPTALQSTSTSEYFYFNNPTGQGVNYFIGRPQRVYSKIEAYNDTKESEELFSYTGNRLTKTEKKPLASNYYLTEEFEYFTNGLLKKKTLSAPGATPAVTPRKTEYTYDATNRFIQTTKDNEDFVTTNNTFHPIYGLVTQTTNHFNQSTYFVYDNWGKQTRVTDFLGKSINYGYTKTNGLYTTTQTADDGNNSKSIADALGRITIKGSTDINNNWVITKTEYDWLDRKYRESEPYFETTQTPTQWNTTFYDDYSRPWKTVAHTGLTGTINYSGGLTVSTYDGTKTVTTTLNANGHKISSTDPGGTINYSYFADGNLKQTVYENVTLTMTYDAWGRKASLNDPSAGLYTYTYNAFGEVLQETTPKGTTTYTYTPTGKIDIKQIVGDNTNISTKYNYNADKMLVNMVVTNTIDGDSRYDYFYDNHKRLEKTVETQPEAVYENIVSFDDFGRPAAQELKARHLPTNKTSNTKTRNVYKNGHSWKLQNFANNQDLWVTTTTNARGQLTQGNYGNAINVSNVYDSFGFPQRQRHTYGTAVLMDLENNFEPTRGLLQYRTNSLFNFTESFQYDNLERLTHTYKNGTLVEQQVYDNKGRITNNNTGNYAYENAAKPYQNTKIANSNNLFRLKVDYNAFKSPVSIGINRTSNPEIYRFTYNTFYQRSRMLYSINSRFRTLPTIKNYSADGHIEIKNTGNNVEFVTYLAGDAYSSNIIVKSDGVTQNFLNLHRDYLGSIVAISNQAGDVVEKRHFDAWGSLTNLEQNGVVVNIDTNTIYNVNLLLDRGYTGHEHLFKAGLIHMNGRLYDPLMHRFLQPDNYVQDPSNTQNYNRYGYVLNNPLKYTDPSGEEFVAAFITAIVISGIMYTGSAVITGT